MSFDRAARISTIVVVLALGAYGLARPGVVLAGGATWLAFLVFACSGWGWLVVRATRATDPDIGLRAAWGIAAYVAVMGVLIAVGVASRPVILALLGLGAAGFAWRELVTTSPLWQLAQAGARAARRQPLVAYAAIAIGVLALLQITGAIARLDRNPWDDDVAYTPLAKRLLDCGDLIEPFSFRRLAAYGGQFALEGLTGARGTMANVQMLDQGLCFALVLLLVVGYARSLARVPALWLATISLIVVTMPDIAINTASYWSGAALFLALYRTLVRGDLALAVALGAVTCTLRQTYIPIVVLFLAIAMWRMRVDRRAWGRSALIGVGVLVPWFAAAFMSSRTFLFPLVHGTWNHELALSPAGRSWVEELSLLFSSCIDAQPITSTVLLVPLIAFTGDDRPARPLGALLVASIVGFIFTVHGFGEADAFTLWRYAFAPALALFVVFALEIGAESVQLPPLGRWLLLAALLVQLIGARTGIVKHYGYIFGDLREATAIDRHGDPNARAEAKRYAAMQAMIPESARVLVMVDDPAFLDFRRNRIAILDTPGFASPGAQMPSFEGSSALRAYLQGEGYRYVAFVRPERSRYFYRREFWVWRLFNDTEFFQAMSAYLIDTIDTFGAFATHLHVIYDQDGLVVVDLDSAAELPASAPPPTANEPDRREAFVHAVANREHLEREWTLSSRRDLVFEDGLSNLTYAQPADDARWYDFFVHDPNPKRGQPIRWLSRRAHLRVRGDGHMHLVLRGRINVGMVFTRPRLDVSIDGELLGSFVTDDNGAFAVELDVTASRTWSDLYIVMSSVGQAERDVRDLRVARLEEVQWESR
jgi:hypothetical protein